MVVIKTKYFICNRKSGQEIEKDVILSMGYFVVGALNFRLVLELDAA